MNADRVSRMKANVRSENKVWGERYIGRKRKNNPPFVYALGETVLIRFPFSIKSKAAPKRSVIKGKVIKRNLKLSRYKISFVSPKTKANWVSVEDITSTTAEEEKKEKERSKVKGCRNKEVKITFKKSTKRSKYYMPMERHDHFYSFEEQEHRVAFNPNGDGSCQFAAVAFLLKNIGIFRSADTLRREIVKYLTEHRNAADGTPQELFAAVPWDEYISGMPLSSTFGDQLTLQAVANLYQVQFLVI